ncbi:hypothetical protein KAX02_10670, partial [candidate division WOR-3 bacterium]|nr:hypothetical protein [candidate division WOR-3 bacterium]
MSGSFGVDIRKNYKTVFLNTSVTLHAYEVLESSIFNLKRAENKLVGFAVSDVNGRLEIQQSNGSWMPDVISSFDLNISQVGVNKCFFYNVSGSIYKDETNDINASVLNGVNLPPLNPIPGDIIYLGSYIRCNKFKLNIGTAAANISNSLFKHEYYNGSWKTVAHVLDNTSDFVNLGSNFISFDMP